MSFRTTLAIAVAAISFAGAALAEGKIMIDDAYARASGKNAKAGAAFMVIMNHGEDDRLIGAKSDVAARVELHTHKIDDNGVAKMIEVEEGFEIPAGESHMLKRGGDHVMFMGLKQSFEQGDMIPVTLIFDKAGEMQVEIPVDLERKPGGGMTHNH